MTSPEPDIESLIDTLRSDLPDREHAARMRARLVAAGIMSGSVVAAPGAAAGASGAASSGGAAAGTSVVSKAALVLEGSKIWLTAVVIGASAAVPVALHLSDGSSEKGASAAFAPSRNVKEIVVAPADTRQAAPRQELVQPAMIATETPAARSLAPPAAPARPLTTRQPSPTESQSRSEAKLSTPPASVVAFPALQKPTSESTLREETELMDRALSALRSGDGSKARDLLREHAQRFPNGALLRERERALVRLNDAELSNSSAKPH